MSQYAAGRGETLVLVSRADLTALCGYRALITSQPVTGPLLPVGSGLTPGRGVAPGSPESTTPGAPESVSTVITTTTTPGSVVAGGGPSGGGFPVGGGVPVAPYSGLPDNTLLYVGLAVLAFVMLSR